MRGGQAVHPEHLVEPRAARHQDELDEREVGPVQGGQLADRGELAAERGELVEAAVAEPHREDEATVADQEGDDLGAADRPGPRQRDRARRAGSASSRWPS